jgi:hypothetical protein
MIECYISWTDIDCALLLYVKTILKLPALSPIGRQPPLTRDIAQVCIRMNRKNPTDRCSLASNKLERWARRASKQTKPARDQISATKFLSFPKQRKGATGKYLSGL